MPTFARLVSSIALALTLAGQVALLVHMGAVPHERCAEHGELVEGQAQHAPDRSRDDGAANVSASSPADADSHDHCPLGTRAMDATRGRPAQLAAPLPNAVDAPSTAPAPPFVCARTYLVAPKQSPPLG